MQGILPERHAINEDLSLRHIVNARQQADKCALARSRLSNNCICGPQRNPQVDVFEDRLTVIRERKVADIDLSPNLTRNPLLGGARAWVLLCNFMVRSTGKNLRAVTSNVSADHP